MLKENEDVEAPVFKSHSQTTKKRDGTGIVGFVGIISETPFGEVTFLFGQEIGGSWEVGKEKCRGEGDSDGDDTFDNEQPSPPSNSMSSIEISKDTCGQETTEPAQ